MKKFFSLGLSLLLLNCIFVTKVQAETVTGARKFKTWAVENSTSSASKEQTATAASQWKKNLASRVAQKHTTAVKPTVASIPANAPKSVGTSKAMAVAKPVASTVGDTSSRANSLENKKALKAATKAKLRKAKLNKNNKKSEAAKTGTKLYASSWQIKNAQLNLKKLGYMSEYATGRMTAATTEGLKRFQDKYGLKKTGKLDDVTYHKLDWEGYASKGIKNLGGTAVVREAAKYRGVKYVFGGTTPRGFDCSGYVQYVFKQLRTSITRTADTQAMEGVHVNRSQLKPGDLVFFTTYEPGASHVGIYAGAGKFWHTSSSRGVMLSGLTDEYWRTRYYGARRLLVSNGEPNV